MSTITNNLSALDNNEIFTHLISKNDCFVHDHNYYEFFYILNGKIKHVFNDKPQLLSAGDFILICPGDIHWFDRKLGEECTHRDIIFTDELFRSVCNSIDIKLFDTICAKYAKTHVKLDVNELNYFEKLLNSLNVSHFSKTNDSDILSRIVGNIIISAYAQAIYDNSNADEKTKSPWFEELLERFHEIKYVRSGLDSIMKDSFYNRIYMCKIFKQNTGLTMTEYLNNVRMEYAALYLRTTNLTIEQIVEDLGFSSTTFFYNKFKQKFNCSPKDYRKKNSLSRSQKTTDKASD